jgi:[ribosomal protein S5]-alanine N-acetyltransferase
MQLETERLILREFAAEDWRDVHVCTSDPLLVQYMSFGPYTPAEAQEWVNGCVSRAGTAAALLRAGRGAAMTTR